MSKGLKDRDVFSLQQGEDGTLFAGTNHGVMQFSRKADLWEPASEVVKEKIIPAPKKYVTTKAGKKVLAKEQPKPKVEYEKSELTAQVSQLAFTDKYWYAASSAGLYSSHDDGKMWHHAATDGEARFLAVSAAGDKAVAATALTAYLSTDHGENWAQIAVPKYVTGIYSVTVAPDQSLWLATQQGALRSADEGKTWDHVTSGLPWKHVLTVSVDSLHHRMLATARDARGVYSSSDNGATWKFSQDSGLLVRSAVGYRGGYIAATAFNGLELSTTAEATASAAQGNGNSGGSR
jgi:photosystem II stability/assembly factor-like uncharacterized protein